MQLVTINTILKWMEEQVSERHVVSPETWLDAGMKLNVLRGEEDDRYWILRQDVAKQRATLLENNITVAKANAQMEATDIYREMKQLGSRIERIKEYILLAKKFATLKADEARGNF